MFGSRLLVFFGFEKPILDQGECIPYLSKQKLAYCFTLVSSVLFALSGAYLGFLDPLPIQNSWLAGLLLFFVIFIFIILLHRLFLTMCGYPIQRPIEFLTGVFNAQDKNQWRPGPLPLILMTFLALIFSQPILLLINRAEVGGNIGLYIDKKVAVFQNNEQKLVQNNQDELIRDKLMLEDQLSMTTSGPAVNSVPQSSATSKSSKLLQPLYNKRKALIIGVQNYSNKSLLLKNTISDAAAMRAKLSQMGYDVSEYSIDETAEQIQLRIHRYEKSIKPGDYSIVYYAGHGFQDNSSNYITGVNVNVEDLKKGVNKNIAITPIMDQIISLKPALSILLLDACREWWDPAAGHKNGLAQWIGSSGQGNYYYVMAAQPGRAAYDGAGKHGIFTGALLNHIDEPKDFQTILNRVTKEVSDTSRGNQLPVITSSPMEPVYLIDSSIFRKFKSNSTFSELQEKEPLKNTVCSKYLGPSGGSANRNLVTCLMAEINLKTNQLASLKDYQDGPLAEKVLMYRKSLMSSGLIEERVSQMWSDPKSFFINIFLTIVITLLLIAGDLIRYFSPQAISAIRRYELLRCQNARKGLKEFHFKTNDAVASQLKRSPNSAANFNFSRYEAWDLATDFYRTDGSVSSTPRDGRASMDTYKKFVSSLG